MKNTTVFCNWEKTRGKRKWGSKTLVKWTRHEMSITNPCFQRRHRTSVKKALGDDSPRKTRVRVAGGAITCNGAVSRQPVTLPAPFLHGAHNREHHSTFITNTNAAVPSHGDALVPSRNEPRHVQPPYNNWRTWFDRGERDLRAAHTDAIRFQHRTDVGLWSLRTDNAKGELQHVNAENAFWWIRTTDI